MKKIYIFLFAIATTSLVQAQTLVASYPFNGNANDASGNGNNGTVNNATLTTDRFGNANSAYLFNGTSSYIQVPDAASLRFSGPYSITAWVQPAAFYAGPCQANTMVNKGAYQSQDAYHLGYGDNLLDGGNCSAFDPAKETFFATYAKGGTEYYAYDPTVVQLNRWYMVTQVYDGTNIKIYVNGKLKGTGAVGTTGGASNTDPLLFGKYVSTSNPYWLNGKLDDVMLYNGALSDAQIFDAYVSDVKNPGSGTAVQLTGTGNISTSPYINLGSGFDFGTQPFTYETWMKRDVISTTLNNYGKILFVGDNDNAWGVGILNNNTLFFTKVGVNGVLSTSTIADTKWHHVAVVYTGTQIQFYVDGADAGASSYTDNFSNTSGAYLIGPRQSFGNANGDQTLDGRIDEIRIWRNVALTQSQIRDWMCKKITSAHPAFSNLYAYFRFDEASGATAGGYGSVYGTLVNSPVWLLSGAALGDASAYDYSNATKTATLVAPTGESFTATETAGAPAGIQVYRVDALPNSVAGTNTGGNKKYFGVFQAGGLSPQYTAVYHYNGNPLLAYTNENNLHLFKRTDNSVATWTDCNAVLNTTDKSLTATGQSTEYILGTLGNPLPVTLLQFTGNKLNGQSQLSWATADETNFSRFEVEKSSNGSNFSTLSTVMAKGGVNNRYETNDASPANGRNFYRLKLVDQNNGYKYSNVVLIDFSGKAFLTVFPNPARTTINVSTGLVVKTIFVLDAGGRRIKQFTPSADNQYDVSDLKAGNYFIEVSDGKEVRTQLFSRQ